MGPPPHIAIVWGGREKDFQRGEGKINQSNHAGEHGLVRTAYVWPGGGGHLRGERRESDRENERMIAMARKQREKDPRPRPQPPRTSQARRVAGIIVGPGSVVPGPLEPSLSRDRSRTLHRSGSRRSRIGRSVHMERRAITFCHFLWILTGIVTVNLSRATCFSCFMGLGRN